MPFATPASRARRTAPRRAALSIVLAALSLTGLCGPALAQAPSFETPTEPVAVPGQFIVRFSEAVGAASGARLLSQQGVEVIDTLPLIGAQIVTLPRTRGEQDRLRTAIDQLPGVLWSEPVYEVRAAATPNDPRYPDQWGFPRINAPAAWDRRSDAGGVIVAVIDTGVDYTHPDVAGNMWTNPGEIPDNGVDDDGNGVVDDVHGANVTGTSPTGDPMDDNGHGTHVAGTIAAVTNNGSSVAGTAWTGEIMALKFLGGNGSGTTAGAIRAIEYAIEMDADVMNNSWGGGGFSRALREAIQAASDAGILFVAAAGNASQDNDATPFYPASYDVPNVVSVMATDRNDGKAGFSHFGATTVDLGAPGVDILSTVPGGGLGAFNGTSMATPHVSGAAALVIAEAPGISVADLKARLMDTAEPIPALSGLSVTGARLDLARALMPDGPPPDGPDEPDRPEDPCAAEPPRFAYGEFFWSDGVTLDGNDNLLSVSFSLPTAMVVDIGVNASVRRSEGSGVTTFRTGVYDQETPNVMWTGSYRRGSLTANEVSRPVSSSFAVRLPAGDHTIWWKLWVSGATLRFDSGALSVRAFPCSMGGKLDDAGAAAMDGEEAVTEAATAERSETGAGGVSVTIAE